MKKLIAILMVFYMMFGVMVEDGFAAEQQSNVSYVTEDREVKFQQVEGGTYHSVGLSRDGMVYSWGRNNSGQLGDGTMTDKSIPVPIMDNVRRIAVAFEQSFAITLENELYAWGRNVNGQLGDGTTMNQLEPIKVMENVKSVATGNSHTLILTMDGEVYGVGRNYLGSLGQGATDTTILKPVKIMDNIQKIAAEFDHSMVLTKDGALYNFGNFRGSILPHYQPTKIMENVRDIACGNCTEFAITNNNELYGWGADLSHNALMTNRDIKEPIKLHSNVQNVSAYNQVLILDLNNNLIVWGGNYSGELGNNSKVNSLSPIKIMENMSFIEANYHHSFAVTENGELYGWGLNQDGMVGNGLTTGNTLTPTKIQVFDHNMIPRIEFDSEEVTLPINMTATIAATVYNSTSTEATWTSSDPNIVTINDIGEVTTVGIGTAQITMTTGDGITNSFKIIVTENDTPTPETPFLSLLLEIGEEAQLSISSILGDNQNMIWSSTDDTIVIVDQNGYITAHSEGVTRIYAENEADSFYINVKVIASGTANEYRLAVDLQSGQTARLYLSDSENIIWSSMDESIATIDETGKITAVSEGLAIMQAELDGHTYIIYIRVR